MIPTVVGLGEILWDLLPSGRQLGGAPANFAYCSHLLGSRAVIASRIGEDELGREASELLRRSGLGNQFLQIDPDHSTGTVHVQLNDQGQPVFDITHPVAWDFMESTESWQSLAKSCDAVCFGTLAQRCEASRATINEFLKLTPKKALRVFDINLRQPHYSVETVQTSLELADIVKLNDEELPKLAKMVDIDVADEISFCRELIRRFNLELICITSGANGSLLVTEDDSDKHPGFQVAVQDTVGAGDAFTAGLVHEYLRGGSVPAMNDRGNRMGAWVASSRGAMPQAPADGLEQELARLRTR